MKMIKPWTLDSSNVSSTAPIDSVPTWETNDGFFEEITEPYVVASGSSFYFAGNGTVKKKDPANRTTVDTGISIAGRAFGIFADPTGTYIAVKIFPSTINIYSTFDYSIVGSHTESNFISDVVFWRQGSIVILSGNTVKEIQIPAMVTAWSIDSASQMGLYYSSSASSITTYDDRYVFIAGYKLDSQASNGTLYIQKYDTVSESITTETFSNETSGPVVEANEYADNIIVIAYGYSYEALVFDENLAQVTTPVTISGSWKDVKVIDGEVIFISTILSSPVERFDATDYSALPGFPELTSNQIIGYTGNAGYFATAYYGGFDFIDKSDMSLVADSNPLVVSGDKYRYDDKIYEVITDNNDKPTDGVLMDPPTWLDAGYINPLRMIDGKLDSKTTANFHLSIEVSPLGLTNAIALLNIEAATVRVTAESAADGAVYDSGDVSMIDNSNVMSWYDFFWQPYDRKADITFTDLPAYSDMTISVYVENNELDTSVGELVVGQLYRIGDAQYGTSVGIVDYSRKETDDFGNYVIIERRFTKKAEYDVKINPTAVSSVQRTLANYRVTPVVWIGDEEMQETIVYGYYKSFDITLASMAWADATITVEGL